MDGEIVIAGGCAPIPPEYDFIPLGPQVRAWLGLDEEPEPQAGMTWRRRGYCPGCGSTAVEHSPDRVRPRRCRRCGDNWAPMYPSPVGSQR